MSASQLSSDDLVRRVYDWVFITGSRRLLAGFLVLGIAVLTAGLIAAGALNVGPKSAAYSVFGSGFVAGLLTLVTVALSVNQLVLSRILGSPGDLKEDVESAIQFRSNVEGIAGDPSTPTNPGAFLRLLGETLQEEVGDFQRHVSSVDSDLAAEFADYTADLVEFGGRLSEISPEADSTNVLHQMLTTSMPPTSLTRGRCGTATSGTCRRAPTGA